MGELDELLRQRTGELERAMSQLNNTLRSSTERAHRILALPLRVSAQRQSATRPVAVSPPVPATMPSPIVVPNTPSGRQVLRNKRKNAVRPQN